jgi:aspartyl-tRNA(Asn)/glutamyl-tRNA(Gln) amidotransferase subunit A
VSRAPLLLNGDFESLRGALDAGEVTAVELARESLERARRTNPRLNAFITIGEEAEVLAAAESADARLRAGEKGGVLGVPVAVKDLILTEGQRTTAASRMLADFRAPYDSTVAAKLKAAGAVIMGKTNLDEFAMGSSNQTSHFGPSKNPWDTERVPGGSSGGSGAAVAARVSPLSLGTDTGGSIRQPASFCGITGLKPTYGRVSRYGVVAFASSLDQVGPMCTDALGCAATLEAISGRDVHDATSSPRPVPHFLEETKAFRDRQGLKGLRVGVPKEFLGEGLDAEVSAVVQKSFDDLRALGAELKPISLPHTRFALPVYYIVATSEASSNLARYDGVHYGHRSQEFQGGALEDLYSLSRGEGFGEEVRLRILLGTYTLSSGYYDAYYRKASQVRALMRRDFEEAFRDCDLIASPTSPTTAFRLGEKTDDPIAMYLADVYTLSLNLAGLPGLSMNVGFDSKRLPVGLQLIAPWWEESRLLGAAASYQAAHPSTTLPSPMAASFGSDGATPAGGIA